MGILKELASRRCRESAGIGGFSSQDRIQSHVGIDNWHVIFYVGAMKVLVAFLLWCLLLLCCWPLAVAALILFPLVWVVALPFRLAWIVADAFFALIKAVLLLPARLLGHRSS